MKRKALGKGLRSLIPEAPQAELPPPVATGTAGVHQLDLDLIRPNPHQPREAFDEAGLAQLAESMKTRGVLQPVVVRQAARGGYELVAGERRWRAAQIAGLMKLPAIVRSTDDGEMLELALIENVQREDLNPVEAAQAYQRLLELGLTQQEIAAKVGKDRSSVANSLRLLNLPADVRERIRSGRVSLGHAKALASLANSKAQSELAERIDREGLSVRVVEAIVGRAASRKAVSATPAVPDRDPNVVAAEATLQRALGTKVRIVHTGKRGRVEVFFFSDEELERLYQRLVASPDN